MLPTYPFLYILRYSVLKFYHENLQGLIRKNEGYTENHKQVKVIHNWKHINSNFDETVESFSLTKR